MEFNNGLPSGEGGVRCPECGGIARPDKGHMVLFAGQRLVLIEDIPAYVCGVCYEQLFSEEIQAKVERVRAGQVGDELCRREIRVPVFSWDDL